MSDQQLISILATLLNHPEFQEGLQDGVEAFEDNLFDADLQKPWTEDEIIELVKGELSKTVYQHTRLVGRVMNWPIPPYLTHLGFTISYLALILAAKANQKQQGGEDATG